MWKGTDGTLVFGLCDNINGDVRIGIECLRADGKNPMILSVAFLHLFRLNLPAPQNHRHHSTSCTSTIYITTHTNVHTHTYLYISSCLHTSNRRGTTARVPQANNNKKKRIPLYVLHVRVRCRAAKATLVRVGLLQSQQSFSTVFTVRLSLSLCAGVMGVWEYRSAGIMALFLCAWLQWWG